MNIQELDSYLRSVFAIDNMAAIDSSLNGIQISSRQKEIRRVACAVDAALPVFEEAAAWKADMLFVHHGLFWGKEQAICDIHYERVRFLMDHNIALYACHLPLDSHPELGNNAGMAQVLDLQECREFYRYKGQAIGIKGKLQEPMDITTIARKLFGNSALAILPFGAELVYSTGIVSGGAPYAVYDAVKEHLDAFITGDASHAVYHYCREAGMNVIFGGHYLSEIWGVKHVARKLEADTDIRTIFIDKPTSL